MGGQYYHDMKCDGRKVSCLKSGCIDCLFSRQIPIYLFSKLMTSTFANLCVTKSPSLLFQLISNYQVEADIASRRGHWQMKHAQVLSFLLKNLIEKNEANKEIAKYGGTCVIILLKI